MYAVKASLEEDIESLQKNLAIHKATTSTPSLNPNNHQTTPQETTSTPVFSAQQHDSQPESAMFNQGSHPYPTDTYVTVQNPYIYIAKAQVHRSQQLPNGKYEYDIFTKTSRYTYHQDYVSLFQNIQDAEPPQVESATNYNSFSSKPQQNKPSTVKNNSNAYKKSSHNAFNSAFMRQQTYCSPCSDDNDDNTTTNEDDDVVFLRTNKPLMPNQFQFIAQPKEIKIDSTNMLRFAKDWNISWTDCTQDPREFYEILRIRLEAYGILIKPYMNLSKDEDIAVITESNCCNYRNAHSEMSHAIFSAMQTQKVNWFGSNPKVDLLNYYKTDHNGFGFLKEILSDSHPNLMTLTNHRQWINLVYVNLVPGLVL